MHIYTTNAFTRVNLLAAAMLGLTVASSHAAEVVWEAPHNITGDSDVSVIGTLVGAYNVGDGGVTAAMVSGVTFQPFALDSTSGPVDSGAEGNFELVTTDLFISENTFYGSTATPFTTLSSGYQSLLASATIVAEPATFTLTMSGLTIGKEYQFQWWANTSATGSQQHRATATNVVTLTDNVTGFQGGLGQFATGTFTADATSQVITFSAVGTLNFGQINAFQLREVPEPSSVALLGVALVTLGFRNRCRRKG